MEGNIIQKVLFSREEVKEILDYCSDWKVSMIGNGHKSLVNKYVRNSFSCDVSDNSLVRSILFPKLNELDVYDVSLGISVLHYLKGCYFKRHTDGIASRYKTLVIQLSNSEDYVGGDLEVEDIPVSREIGNVILFPAGAFHEVKEVISGNRYSLIAFLSPKDMNINIKTII